MYISWMASAKTNGILVSLWFLLIKNSSQHLLSYNVSVTVYKRKSHQTVSSVESVNWIEKTMTLARKVLLQLLGRQDLDGQWHLSIVIVSPQQDTTHLACTRDLVCMVLCWKWYFHSRHRLAVMHKRTVLILPALHIYRQQGTTFFKQA